MLQSVTRILKPEAEEEEFSHQQLQHMHPAPSSPKEPLDEDPESRSDHLFIRSHLNVINKELRICCVSKESWAAIKIWSQVGALNLPLVRL